MGRKLTGWVRKRGRSFYIGFRLRSGVAWERAARDTHGAALGREDAKALIAALVADYASGRWDPEKGMPAATPEPASSEPIPTVSQYATAWGATQRYESAPEDRATIARYIARAPLGAMVIDQVRPRHARAFIQWLIVHPSERGGTLAPRTVRNAFDVLRRALRSAVVDELLSSNPCEPVRGELPEIEDKDPTARVTWDFSRAEIEALVSDPRLYLDRRVVHALRLLTGARIGEIAALRWRDWDRATKTLTKLTISRAIKSVSRTEGATKTRAIKVVPVHPALEHVLSDWWSHGWGETFSRDPRPDDLIAPTARGARRGEPRTSHAENEAFQNDQRVLGFAHVRHQHVARHAFVSRTLADGGDGAVLRWITHAPPRTAHDGYTRGLGAALRRDHEAPALAAGHRSAHRPERSRRHRAEGRGARGRVAPSCLAARELARVALGAAARARQPAQRPPEDSSINRLCCRRPSFSASKPRRRTGIEACRRSRMLDDLVRGRPK